METNSDKPKPSIGAVVLLLVDLYLVVNWFWGFGFVVPMVGGVFMDDKYPLPGPTQALLNISKMCMTFHGAFLFGMLCFVLWRIIYQFRIRLGEAGRWWGKDERPLIRWLLYVFMILLGLYFALTFTMLLPIF